MHKQLEGDGTDRGEGIQQFLDEGRDGGADSRSNTLNRSSHNKQTLSYHRRGDTSNRAGDQGIQREDGDKGENERRAGVGGDARDSLQRSLHLPVEDFGTNYPEYYHDGKGAIEKLLQTKEGQVQGAFYRPDIGDITLVWGKEGTGKSDGFGLSKIAKFHPEVIDKLDKLINTLPITKESPNRYQLENEKYKLAIRKEYEGDKENWVLTAFEKDGNSVSSRTDFRNAHTQATDKTTSVRAKSNSTTQELKNQEFNAEKISEQLSEEFKEAYNKYEGTKSTEYQQTKEIEKSDLTTEITANVYTKVADEIMDRSSLELAHHNNWVKETIKDPFGINFKKSTFSTIRGKEALETLLTYKLGQVKGAFYKEGLGDIDLVWGDSKMGLAHILEKHPEVIEKIPEIINDGKLVTTQAGIQTIIDGEYKVGLSKGFNHKGDNNWIVTAYEDTRGRDKTFDSAPVNPKETLSEPSMPNPTTEKIKNQELGEEIQQEALDLADKASPTQDTQPYLPLVESVEKRVLQNKAEAKKEIVFNDLEDIKKDLPYLLKEQAEDVKFAEQRFSTGGRGVLFTNGTGTGKTFTGLGIAKRKLKMGAKNILILTQSTQKNLDWKKEGKILNIDIVEVSNTKDNPNGTIIATYANFRENKGLNSRTYDLIIYDESQSILGSKEGSITEIFEQHQNIAIWNYLAIKIINHLCDNAHFYPRSSLVA